MRTLQIIPPNTKIRFIERRFAAFLISAVLVCASLGLFAIKGLNFGIDFLGGIVIEIKTDGPADLADLRSRVGGLGLGDVSLQEFGEPDVVLVRVQRQEGAEAAQLAAVAEVRAALDDVVVEYRRTESVGPTVGAELREAAIWAVIAAITAILLYVWFRFEWQFGIAAIVALAHDVITTIGLFSLLALDFNLATVAAILTIAGYSINDTVVVFDRVRENLRKYKKMPLPELFNLSINQVLSRTIITGLTTLLALTALYTVGGEVLRGFTIALIWGIVIGTYSSVAVATPLLLYLGLQRGGDEEEGEIEKKKPKSKAADKARAAQPAAE